MLCRPPAYCRGSKTAASDCFFQAAEAVTILKVDRVLVVPHGQIRRLLSDWPTAFGPWDGGERKNLAVLGSDMRTTAPWLWFLPLADQFPAQQCVAAPSMVSTDYSRLPTANTTSPPGISRLRHRFRQEPPWYRVIPVVNQFQPLKALIIDAGKT